MPGRLASLLILIFGLLTVSAEMPVLESIHVPGDLKLAGLRDVVHGQPIKAWLYSVRPKEPYFYSEPSAKFSQAATVSVELKDCAGSTLLKRNYPFSGGKWQSLLLETKNLSPGRYDLQAEIRYDGLLFNKISKDIFVLSAADAARSTALWRDAGSLAREGGWEKKPLAGFAESDGREMCVLPAGEVFRANVPGEGRMAVYAWLALPAPSIDVRVGEVSLAVPGQAAGGRAIQEVFLGFGQGDKDNIELRAAQYPLHIVGLRFEPAEKDATAEPSGRQNYGKALVMNNDACSEGFFELDWNPEKMVDQVLRYKNTEVSQLDWCSLVSGVVNYRSQYADFYGEDHNGSWSTAGNKAMALHYRTLDSRQPAMFPWVVQTGREMGLPIWGSLRMSSYYGNHPFGWVMNGRLWRDHPEMRIRLKPDDGESVANMSFAYEPVRRQRIGVLCEIAGFGCDGVNLDFCRYPSIFGYDEPLLEAFRKAYNGDGRGYLLDDPKWIAVRQAAGNAFMREVRWAMNEVGKKRGTPVSISVRFPATKYEVFGFDPKTWVAEGLVDQLIPGFPGYDRWFDVKPWRELTQGTKTRLLVSIEHVRHQTSQTELTDEEVSRGIKPGFQVNNTRDAYLRRAAETYEQGADGLYIFNAWSESEKLRGISDAVFVKSWRRYQDPQNLSSEIAPAANP